MESMRQSLFRMSRLAAGFVFAATTFTVTAAAQPPAQAHYQHNLKRGPAPGGVEQATFFVHRLGTDHAEGITTLDMNGDGGQTFSAERIGMRTPVRRAASGSGISIAKSSMIGEFVSDCGEWTVDVNHDGAPDVVTAGWMTNGMLWYENPRKART